jgi:hypothetical protein
MPPAVGIGVGIAGFCADLAVIGDPVRSREDAASQPMRDRCPCRKLKPLVVGILPGIVIARRIAPAFSSRSSVPSRSCCCSEQSDRVSEIVIRQLRYRIEAQVLVILGRANPPPAI